MGQAPEDDMADLIYLRFSTDKQTDERQRLVLAPWLTADPKGERTFSDPATSGRNTAPLERQGWRDLVMAAKPGDTVHVAEMWRLCRNVAHMIQVCDYLAERKVRLEIHHGAMQGMDLTATDASGTLLRNMLASVGQWQADIQRELTVDGVNAAKAKGKRLGRPASYSDEQRADVIEQHGRGYSARSIARIVGTSARTVGRIIRDHEHDQADGSNDVPQDAPHSTTEAVAVAVPGVCEDALRRGGALDDETRALLDSGRKVKRGSGHQLMLTTTPEQHRALYDVAPAPQTSNDRRAFRRWAAALDEMTA